MVCIFANADLGQTVQGGITKCTELHTYGSAGRVIKPRQEIGERSEHTHHVHGHELLNGINVLDERFDDGDELGPRTKYRSHECAETGRTCSRKFEKVSDQSRSGAPLVEVIS